MHTLLSGAVRPRSGDLVLARVDRLGQHQRIEQPSGRMSRLHLDDEIIVAYADRYAADQFHAHVPPDLGPTQLVAGGGVAARMLSRSRGIRPATDITPIGLVADERGVPLNVADFALPPVPRQPSRPKTIAVVGTSMNSGKTTTNRYLVNGLARANHRPGAAKVTGTGSGGDYWIMIDAGAHRMLDFTDVGFASTYRIPIPDIERKILEIVDHLTVAGSSVVLLEVADGLYQQETAALLRSQVFRSTVDAVIFAAGEAMGAAHGVERLRQLDVPVIAVSGRLTASDLSTREAAEATGLPVLGVEELSDPHTATRLLGLPLRATADEPVERVNARDFIVRMGVEGPATDGLVAIPVSHEQADSGPARAPNSSVYDTPGAVEASERMVADPTGGGYRAG